MKLGVARATLSTETVQALLAAAAERGILDERMVALETLSAIKRAGADLIITYYADRVADWLASWRARLARERRGETDRQAAMRAVNPAYIPRNHRVEEVIAAALEGDLDPFERLLDALARPFDEQPENADLQRPPRPEEVVMVRPQEDLAPPRPGG